MAGIYIHVPFCKQACNYCNFHFSTSLALKEAFLYALIREIKLRSPYLQGQTIETIYFGGGTPSLLSYAELMRIFEALYANFPSIDLLECTLEANPDDVTKTWLSAIKQTPINRFSMGMQSFFEEDLRFMRRAHNAQQAMNSIHAARDAGFGNLSIDLIYGVPTANDEKWRQNLEQTLSLSIPHISAYALTVEPKTLLAHQIKSGVSLPPLADDAARQFEIMTDILESEGYLHYEISNFAKPDHLAIHNTNYWKGKPYIGFGPSAHSYNLESRQWNIANNPLYIKGVESGFGFFEKEELSKKDQFNEYILTNLRTMWGIELAVVEARFGKEALKQLLKSVHRYLQNGMVLQKDEHLLLSHSGKLFADGIAADLFL